VALNPFETVSDYPSMLNKIAAYTFGAAIAATALLRYQVPAIELFLAKFSVPIPVAGFSFPLGTILPAFMFAFGGRVIKLHNKISDLFGIRQRFDVHEILMPLALATGTRVTTSQLEKISSQRRQLMADVFYKYISSSTGKPVIEKHYTTMAFDQWSWYWILLEVSIVAAIVGGVLLFTGKSFAAAIILISILLIIWALQVIRAACARYALQEVNQILSDEDRKREVEDVFSALLDSRT
jgi:hypothetical protein